MEINKCIDGVNCINVYSNSFTIIGKFYSNFAHTPFVCEDGNFNSIEAYWYWIKSGGKSPRDTFGVQAKNRGKSYELINDIDVEKIKKALDIKLRINRNYIKEHDDFSLPLVHYYEYGTKRIAGGYNWIIEHIELRREQLKIYFNKK